LADFGISCDVATSLLSYNTGAIQIANDPIKYELPDYFGSMDDLEAAKCIQWGVANRVENPNTHRRGSASVVFS